MISRRQILSRAGMGIGSLALASLLSDQKLLAAESLASPHFNPTAKSVILLFMGGGVSHVYTFDPKPALSKLDSQPCPESISKNIPAMHRVQLKSLFGSPWKFKQYGQCGMPISELFPNVA